MVPDVVKMVVGQPVEILACSVDCGSSRICKNGWVYYMGVHAHFLFLLYIHYI